MTPGAAAARWTAEHDVVLRSAVEAGASLESLAKGAVCFSDKFTLQELQDHWYSLLYDSEMSSQASARMVEYETELLTSNPAKANKLFNSKAKGFSVYKRKLDSVKIQYYAMRKRVWHEPCLSADYGYVVVPCSSIQKDGHVCACGDELKCSEDHQLVHKVDPCVGGSYAYRQLVQSNGQYPYDMEHANSNGSIVIDGESNHGSLKCYSDVDQLYGYDCMHKNPQISGQTIVSVNSSDLINQFDSEATGSKALLSIVQNGVNYDHFSQYNAGGLLEPDSFNASESPSPSLLTWNKLLGVSSPDTLTDVHRIEQDTPMLCDGKMEKDNNDALVFQENFGGGMSDSGLGNTIVSEGGFMHPNMNGFSEKEDLELLSSEHALDSAVDTNQENVGDSDTKVFLKSSSRGPHRPHLYTTKCGNHIDPIQKKHNLADISGVDTIPASAEVPYHGCDVKCILNTEDYAIPCNDHIPIPSWSSLESTSTLDPDSQHDMCLVPTKPPNMENVVPSRLINLETAIREQNDIMMSLNECYIVGKLPPGMHGDSMHTKAFHSVDDGDETTCGLFQTECCDDLQNLTLDKSIQVPDEMKCRLLADKPSRSCETSIQSHMMSQALPDNKSYHSIESMPTLGQAEGSDSENSVPDYFDLEALILDQELIPWGQESDFIQPEVSRFQSTESRKNLIRLEKGACAYMNRSIMSKGAFAIIYGQHVRYYIRDPEVILGRETVEVHVDIDLGKEGKANKISRRQAVIKMDDHGSFYMKNIGKGSIFVNSKEVPCNKSIILTSDSLIEIRNMKFIFHMNHNAIRQCIIRTRRGSSQGKNTTFDWNQEP